MKEEKDTAKQIYVSMGSMVAILTLVWAAILLARFANITDWNTAVRDQLSEVTDELGHIYDIYPLANCSSYDDEKLAVKLKADILANCTDADCQKLGTQWSTILILNGTTLLLLCVAFILIAIGSKVFYARLAGACLNFWVGFVHFFCIVFTAANTFDDKGKLASICTDKSQFAAFDKEFEFEGYWTFARDGTLIVWIWILQIFTIFIFCCLGSLPLRQTGHYTPLQARQMNASV